MSRDNGAYDIFVELMIQREKEDAEAMAFDLAKKNYLGPDEYFDDSPLPQSIIEPEPVLNKINGKWVFLKGDK